MSEEDIVPLIVECNSTTPYEVRVVGKQTCKHSANGVAKSCPKVVQNQFGKVVG
jgi:hypothetical protein